MSSTTPPRSIPCPRRPDRGRRDRGRSRSARCRDRADAPARTTVGVGRRHGGQRCRQLVGVGGGEDRIALAGPGSTGTATAGGGATAHRERRRGQRRRPDCRLVGEDDRRVRGHRYPDDDRGGPLGVDHYAERVVEREHADPRATGQVEDDAGGIRSSADAHLPHRVVDRHDRSSSDGAAVTPLRSMNARRVDQRLVRERHLAVEREREAHDVGQDHALDRLQRRRPGRGWTESGGDGGQRRWWRRGWRARPRSGAAPMRRPLAGRPTAFATAPRLAPDVVRGRPRSCAQPSVPGRAGNWLDTRA